MAIMHLPDTRALKDVPALRQFAVLIGIAVAVAAGIGIWSWSQRPGYVPVFANLSDRDAGELAEALRSAGIPYRLDSASGAVTVPQEQLYDARLKLAAQGLPHEGGQGFELIQQEQGFGTSQFIENARYQHAMETELARTIGNLRPVRAARVHLAVPKPSAFARKSDAPSASVFVELHNGRTLEQDQVASIVHLVASSVAGLQPQAVTVIDQYGHLLSNANPDSAMARTAEQFDYTRRVESEYQRRIEQLLLPMVGAGRVSAQVSADIDFAEIEEAREQYTPDAGKLRSEQIAEDVTRGGARPPAGIPGATSNQPAAANASPPLNNPAALAAAGVDPATAAADGADSPIQTQSKQATRTYELDRTVSHTRQSVGRLKRLSIAVLVDHLPKTEGEGEQQKTVIKALSSEELAKVESLVKEAVGFDAARGDSVAVQNSAFVGTELPQLDPLPLWKQPQTMRIAQQAGGVLVVLALILFILRPALRQLLATPVAAQAPVPMAQADLSGNERVDMTTLAEDQVTLIGKAPESAYEQKLQLARTAVTQDPKRVAQVVKTWIGQEAT